MCCNICTAQNKIEGRVTFIGNTPVENAIIVVKALTDKGERIVANTTTNKQGLYAVTLSSDNKRLVLYVSGFDINTLRKEIANTPQTIDFVAEPRNFELQEVFVKPTSIEAKGDTLTYNIALFKDKNDRILRETLERMPGISVNDAGKVLYNGREITEFQIEGNNLFENKYSIALDRIDPKDIVAVDVMQHHQPIRALQGSRITDDVAINLKLSANAKDNLSGKMEMGGGYRDGNRSNLVYTAHLYGGLFNARQQLFATTAINNSGDQLRSVYAVPLTMLQENILSTTTPQNSILGQNDYMTNQSKALSLNGLYKNAENSKWSYAVTAINENTEGHTDITPVRDKILPPNQTAHEPRAQHRRKRRRKTDPGLERIVSHLQTGGGDSQNKSNISPTYLKNKIYEEKNYSGIDPDDEPCLCHGTEVGYHGTTLLELQRDQ